MNDFSVLLSVYYKEKPEYLKQALDSVFNQTKRASQVVLVEDGPLNSNLYTVIDEYQQHYPEIEVVPLQKNVGLGKALNEGLRRCRYELVARMDTDDISKPERFAKQVTFMNEHPEIDVLSSWIDEFVDNPSIVNSVRKLPETHKELYAFGKKRNPMNHPVVMFRKKAVEAVGGYRHFPLFEDYYLWVRMILNGAKIHNLQESLLYMRTNADMFKRRGGLSYVQKEADFQKFLFDSGYIGVIRYITNMSIRFVTRIIPNNWRSSVYKLIRK